MKTLVLLKPVFIIGFTLPYMYTPGSSTYLNFLYLILQGASNFNLSAIPPVLGLLSLIAYACKSLFSKDWCRGLFISSIVALTFFPSLLFITSITYLNGLFDLSISMYLTGLAVTIAIIPCLILVSQVESICKLKGSVVLPAVGTLIGYDLVNFLIVAGSKETVVTDLTHLGSNLMLQIGGTIMTFFSNYPQASYSSEGGITLNSDVVWVGAIFSLTSAFYFYYRLSNTRDGQQLQVLPRLPSRSFSTIAVTILVAIFLNFVLLHLSNASTILLLPLVNFSLIGALLLVLISIPRGH